MTNNYSVVLRFLFITESEEFTAELFSDPYVQKHSKVAAVRKVFGPEEHFINFGYNFFQPGRGIKIHTFLAFLFVILPNKHRPSFLGTFVIAIHRVARNIYGPALPCTFVINKTPGGQF